MTICKFQSNFDFEVGCLDFNYFEFLKVSSWAWCVRCWCIFTPYVYVLIDKMQLKIQVQN